MVSQPIDALLSGAPRAVNIGVEQFVRPLRAWDSDILSVDWAPPPGGIPLAQALDRLEAPEIAPRIEAANARVVERFLGARPALVDVQPAAQIVPLLRERALLHAGPPIVWEEMTGPMRGAAIGAVLHEGWAEDEQAAEAMLGAGEVGFTPCHHVGGVGPMGGITSGSMPVLVVHDTAWGGRSFCTLNEGVGRVLRFGAYGPEVQRRLGWIREELGPIVGRALRVGGAVDLASIMARALTMGDELHQRNTAATLLLLRELAPRLAELGLPGAQHRTVLEFMAGTEQFFLNVAMAACKVIADAGSAVGAESSIVTAMARNGVAFGVRMAATGDRWFTAPVNTPRGLYFGGYSQEDASPDIGDSAITETVGLGGFCLAAAPAVVPYLGVGGFDEALVISREMQTIVAASNPNLAIPALDFAGAATGIDVRRTAATSVEPIINTGIAHRSAGVGQVGAGTVRAPLACFEQAVLALAETVV